tara:strand:+ start:264 stop:830 length:567 start_codon:yes stop_codon:yes gene_type:complete
MKLTKQVLREMIQTTFDKMLNEVVTRLSVDSLDDQIDAFLIGFESDSIIEKDGVEENSLSLSNILFEAEPGEEVEVEVDVDVEPDLTGGSEDRDTEKGASPKKPKINIDKFTKKVARLVFNYESLLDPVTVIVNRAKNYLDDAYDKAVKDEFEEILAKEFGIELDQDDEVIIPPPAAAAGPIGGGGGA